MSTPGSVDDILSEEGTDGFGDEQLQGGGGGTGAMEFQVLNNNNNNNNNGGTGEGTTISEKFFGIGEKKQPGPNDKIIKRKAIAQAGDALNNKKMKSATQQQNIANIILSTLSSGTRANIKSKKRPAPSEPLAGEPSAKRQKTDQQQPQPKLKQPKVEVKIEDVPEDIDSSSSGSGSDSDDDDEEENDQSMAGMDTAMEKPPSHFPGVPADIAAAAVTNFAISAINAEQSTVLGSQSAALDSQLKELSNEFKRIKEIAGKFPQLHEEMLETIREHKKHNSELDSTVTKQANDLLQLQTENAELRKSLESVHQQEGLKKILKLLNEKATEALNRPTYSSVAMHNDLLALLASGAKKEKPTAVVTLLKDVIVETMKDFMNTPSFVEILGAHMAPIIDEVMGQGEDEDNGAAASDDEEQEEEAEDEEEEAAPSPPPAPKKSSSNEKKKTAAAADADGSDIFG